MIEHDVEVDGGPGRITHHLRETADNLVELVTAQVRLLRIELFSLTHAVGHGLFNLALFALLLVCGYALLTGALVVALSRSLGLGRALLLVGVANAVVGIAGSLRALRSFRRLRLMDRFRTP